MKSLLTNYIPVQNVLCAAGFLGVSYLTSRAFAYATRNYTKKEGMDDEFSDLFTRLSEFKAFQPSLFDSLEQAVKESEAVRNRIYSRKIPIGSTNAFLIRSSYQKVIEVIRHFRAVLEHKFPDALEDFDDVAAEWNNKIETICNNAILDSYL